MKNMKKCPPGVICVENITLLFIAVSLSVIGLYMYSKKSSGVPQNAVDQTFVFQGKGRGDANSGGMVPFSTQGDYYDGAGDVRLKPNVAYTNAPKDVLLNPYAAPLRDERYMVAERGAGVPINVSTSIDAVDTTYRQLGLLTPISGPTDGKMLPLMGRPLFVSRDKWQYYTMSEQRNSIKLPISRNGRSATTEYGVDKLYNGDQVYVEGYNQPFKVTTYDNDVIKYIPYM